MRSQRLAVFSHIGLISTGEMGRLDSLGERKHMAWTLKTRGK